MSGNQGATVRVRCGECGGGSRVHKVVCEYKTAEGDPDYRVNVYHQLVQCGGCESVRYRRFLLTPDCWDGQLQDFIPSDITIYPDDAASRNKRQHMDSGVKDWVFEDSPIPHAVWKIYGETVDAYNANANTLAGAGLRATVEAICIERGIGGHNLKEQIDELGRKGLLTTPQTELLHEERYLGNAAIHEMATPSKQDLEDGLAIVEGLMTTIYILPHKADRLRRGREEREALKQAERDAWRPGGSTF